MGRNSGPPLDGEAIQQARLAKFMTQLEVAEQVAPKVARHGFKFDRSSLSYIESGAVKRPHPKIVRALAQVLGMQRDEMFQAEDDASKDDEEAEAA